MAYDEQLARRVREVLASEEGLTERKMFGGIAFMLRGNMCCGVMSSDLILRVGAEEAQWALREDPHTRLFDFTGRPMAGMVVVGPAGSERDEDLASWVGLARRFTASLPPK